MSRGIHLGQSSANHPAGAYHADAYNNRGTVLQELARIEEARANYERALAIRPDYPGALTNRGLVALLTGDFQSAIF